MVKTSPNYIKTWISFHLSAVEVLRKPCNQISNAETHAVYISARIPKQNMWAYYTPMGIYHYLLLRTKFEVSQVPNHQKQALVNAIKICLLPHPVMSCRHPSVSLRVQNYKEFLICANKTRDLCVERRFCNEKAHYFPAISAAIALRARKR